MEAAVKIPPGNTQLRYVIDDGSKVGEARRAAQALASFELSADLAGRVAIATTELANNLLNHAREGELLIQALGQEDEVLIELLAIDRGPGIRDVARCMTDGYSTAGTPGTGLGAIRRLATEFEIHSRPDEGTVIMARFGGKTAARFGAISVPLPGEIECGDAWRLIPDDDGLSLIVVDGLGHGTFAAEAARACVTAFSSAPRDAPMDILQRANLAMSKTRGGAAACARLGSGTMTYAGVGNISGHLVTHEKSQGLLSHNGTLGMHQRRTQQLEYPVEPGALLILHSDGISARWDIKSRAELLAQHPAIIAATLYRDYSRGRDDSTIVVVAT